MPRFLLWVSLLAAVFVLEVPLEVAAQTRRSGDTRGSTRSAGSRRSERSSSSRQRSGRRRARADGRRSRRVVRRSDRWYRSRRRRRLVVGVAYDPLRCDYVRDGYCYYMEREYVGNEVLSFGLSFDLVGSVYASNLNGLTSPRVLGEDLNAGVLPGAGGGFRGWLLYDRLRAGVVFASGGASRTRSTRLRNTDIFEEGSELGGAWWLGVWGFGAYQPQLSDLVQLWFGARAGLHTLTMNVDWNGRSYDSVERVAFSAGPELGLMLSGDAGVGVMFWGFADLAVPGHATLTVAFVYEEPKPAGASF